MGNPDFQKEVKKSIDQSIISVVAIMEITCRQSIQVDSVILNDAKILETLNCLKCSNGHRGHDAIKIGFTTTYAISDYHQ